MRTISFEGPDGVGKSTQVEILKDKLEKQGKKVHVEHFPRYDEPIGKLIGDILKGKCNMPSFDAMQMLYAADQTDFRLKLQELEKEGYDYVLLDRYDLSTIVYYCSKYNDMSLLSKVTSWQEGITDPDMTLVLYSPVSINEKEGYKELDEFEKDEVLMSTVSKMYVDMARMIECIRDIKTVYANEGVGKVSRTIEEILKENNLI